MPPLKSKPKPVKKTDTNTLTQLCLTFLKLRGFLAWRQNNGAVFDPVRQAFRSNSSTKGIADILAIEQGGRFWAIEIKTGKDKQSPEQIQFGKDVTKKGGVYLVVKELDDLIKFIENL